MQNCGGENNLRALIRRVKGRKREMKRQLAQRKTRTGLSKSTAPLASAEFACFAYRSVLISPAEREIKPAQNVVTNPFKCGGGGPLRCEPAPP